MQTLKSEMEALSTAPPPKDYTASQINDWLAAIEAAPNKKAIQLLIGSITVFNKNDIRATSALASIVGETGWGSRI